MTRTQALISEDLHQSPSPIQHDVCVYAGGSVPIQAGEFWTSKQRDCHSIHEISYRACYKPQLPGFFIRRYASKGSFVYDPFLGRGTTLVEARLHGCNVIGSDINPLCVVLTRARLCPPSLEMIRARLNTIVLGDADVMQPELLAFYHPDTLREIESWRAYFAMRRELTMYDTIDQWIEMVATNRLSGHSSGFFSVYTLPPNQAVSVARQRKINANRNQQPAYRNTRELIWRKSKALLKDPLPPDFANHNPYLFTASADSVPQVATNSVDLVITSPPFLDAADYLQDNWLRMWFTGTHVIKEHLWKFHSVEQWTSKMQASLAEIRRVLKPAAKVAFEVGEVRKGTIKLEQDILNAGYAVGLKPEYILINTQHFTKTSNCWGIDNNKSGTNSNRIVVFSK